MNPGDYPFLLLSLGFAAVTLVAHGWTLNGIGPALLPAGLKHSIC